VLKDRDLKTSTSLLSEFGLLFTDLHHPIKITATSLSPTPSSPCCLDPRVLTMLFCVAGMQKKGTGSFGKCRNKAPLTTPTEVATQAGGLARAEDCGTGQHLHLHLVHHSVGKNGDCHIYMPGCKVPFLVYLSGRRFNSRKSSVIVDVVRCRAMGVNHLIINDIVQ
jgi:hypothetical protein